MTDRTKKTILTEVDLDEMSAVDDGAMEGAKAAIFKSADGMDFEDAIRKTIAEVEASKSAGDHPSEEEKSMSDETAKVAELENKLADLQKSLEAAEVAKADAEAVSKMSDAEKSYMEGMSADERKAFMGMKPEERARRMKKSAEADETVEVEGETIAKSKVGAEVFAVMKAQAARIEAVEKQATADREAAQMADLRKRADDEFNALPGSVDDRASVLKALDAIENEDVRKAAYTILKAAQEHAEGGLVTKGVSDGTVSKSKADFDAKVTELAKSMPRHEALSKARKQFPAEYEAAYGAN